MYKIGDRVCIVHKPLGSFNKRVGVIAEIVEDPALTDRPYAYVELDATENKKPTRYTVYLDHIALAPREKVVPLPLPG